MTMHLWEFFFNITTLDCKTQTVNKSYLMILWKHLSQAILN